MSQFFPGNAKIGPLTESGGIITLGKSHLLIGGQGYSFESKNYTLSGLSNNVLYYIYAVLSGGVPVLVSSANVNSVGPATYDSWALVGAFYSNDSSSFGVFVNVEGTPRTEWTAYEQTVEAATTNPTKATSRTELPYWCRVGDTMKMRYDYRQTSSSGAGAGSGRYEFINPLGVIIDTAKAQSGNYPNGIVGNGVYRTGSGYYQLTTNIGSPSYLTLYLDTAASTTDQFDEAWGFASDANIRISWVANIPVTGWSNTPLKDL